MANVDGRVVKRRRSRSGGRLRSKRLAIAFSPRDVGDLSAIAEAWQVPVATVGYAIVSDHLARLRRTNGREFGPEDLATAAAVYLLSGESHGSALAALRSIRKSEPRKLAGNE